MRNPTGCGGFPERLSSPSRQTIGAPPFRKVGSHRRVFLEDLQIYRQDLKVIRRKSLDQLAKEAQELGLG